MSENLEDTPAIGTEGQAPWLQTVWDLRAAGNFIGGGAGTGLLILVSLGSFVGLDSPVLLVAGLALVALGLLAVLLEIGRPLRAINVLFGGKRSWMTREAWTAGVLFPLGIAALFKPDLARMVWLPAVMFLYCQGRILEASKGIPTWRSPLILPLMLASGLAEGAGMLLLLGTLVLPAGAPEWVAGVLVGAIAARLFVWMSYRRKMVGGEAPVEAAAVLIRFSMPFTLGGNVIPLAMLVAAGIEPDLRGAALAAAGLAAAVGGWALKIVIVTKAAHNQGFAIQHSPARGGGVSGPGVKPGWREVPKDEK